MDQVRERPNIYFLSVTGAPERYGISLIKIHKREVSKRELFVSGGPPYTGEFLDSAEPVVYWFSFDLSRHGE